MFACKSKVIDLICELMVMGFQKRFITATHHQYHLLLLLLMLSCLCSLEAAMYTNYNSTLLSLDDTFQQYAHASLPRHPQTGVLYNASSLPSNYTGIQVSIVRLRWDSFWRKGANYSNFYMPPRIFSHPYFPRLDIVYSNLGNQSSYYYTLPNHTLAAPVVGFNAYASKSAPASTSRLNLTLFGDPILVQFPNFISTPQAKCVAFYANGSFETTDIIRQDTCVVRDQGHFSIVVERNTTTVDPGIPNKHRSGGNKYVWKWWVFGFGVGVLGLLLGGLIVYVMMRFFRMRRIGRMEREAEKTEGLDTRNVGQSKMPLAMGVRTQPSIENDYVP